MRRSPCPSSSRAAGFTLIEVLVVVAIVTVALGLMTSTIASVGRLGPVNRETSLAMDAARNAAETMRSTGFAQLFATFNTDPDDDPLGPGTAPGSAFVVTGLDLSADDVDGLAGQVLFPTIDGELREDLVDVRLGFPRDLNADDTVDDLDHAGDYAILPFLVRVEWRGRTGDRRLELYSAIARP